jgi:hypothetical protein
MDAEDVDTTSTGAFLLIDHAGKGSPGILVLESDANRWAITQQELGRAPFVQEWVRKSIRKFGVDITHTADIPKLLVRSEQCISGSEFSPKTSSDLERHRGSTEGVFDRDVILEVVAPAVEPASTTRAGGGRANDAKDVPSGSFCATGLSVGRPLGARSLVQVQLNHRLSLLHTSSKPSIALLDNSRQLIKRIIDHPVLLVVCERYLCPRRSRHVEIAAIRRHIESLIAGNIS